MRFVALCHVVMFFVVALIDAPGFFQASNCVFPLFHHALGMRSRVVLVFGISLSCLIFAASLEFPMAGSDVERQRYVLGGPAPACL